MLDFEAFWHALKPFSNIALTAPAGADGDSVGTQTSMRELILQAYPNKEVRIINEEPCPIRYQFLKQSKHFEVSETVLKSPQTTWPDLMICVDGGAPRIGPDTTKLWNHSKQRAQIDHHALGGNGDTYNFRLYDPEAAATVEIVFGLIKKLGLKLTPDVAQSIYVGLIFDTGMFKHSNTRPSTMRIGAELLETGFNHTKTAEESMMIRSEGAFQMLKAVLARAVFDLQGRYVWTVLDYDSFQKAGGDSDDREGLIDQIFLTKNCEIAAFYFEKKPNDWKISFRSRAKDVASLARSLNPEGGGHIQAAGCSLSGPENQVLSVCHLAVSKILQNA